MFITDLFLQSLVLMFGYLLGGGSLLLLLWLIGSPLTWSQASLLVLALPLASTLIVEGFTNLWQHTPGTLGLGALWAIFPLMAAGALAVLIAFAGQRLLPPFDPGLPRDSPGVTGWVLAAVICSLISLALWRWWPEPRARLF